MKADRIVVQILFAIFFGAMPVLASAADAGAARASALIQQANRAADTIASEIGASLGPARQSALAGTTDGSKVDTQSERVDREVLKPLMEAASLSCDAVDGASMGVTMLDARFQKLGVSTPASVEGARTHIVSKSNSCEEAAKAACRQKAEPAILISFWKTSALRRQLLITDGVAEPADMEKRAKNICLPHKSYRVTGNAGPMTVTGTACNLKERFTTNGVGGSMEVQWVYNPTSENGGTVSYTGRGTGAVSMVRMAGDGTYTVTIDNNGGSLKYITTGRVTNPGGGGATNSTTLKLTPIDPC